MNIIFLDIDGVLNNFRTQDSIKGYLGIEDSKVNLLKELCDKTDSKIVLSSDWRLHENENDPFWQYLNQKLNKADLSIYDVTPDFSWSQRAYEISSWVESHKKIEHIVILDDMDFYWDTPMEKYWIDTAAFGGGFANVHGGIIQEHVDYIVKNYDRFEVKNDAENK